MLNNNRQLTLKAYLSLDYLHLATSFTEESARIFHLDRAEALKLTLACEEVFSYLCHLSSPDEPISIEITGGGYFARLEIPLNSRTFNPRRLNLTASVSPDDAADLEDMGLLIASRSVDRFQILSGAPGSLKLVLIKERAYPAPVGMNPPEPRTISNPLIETPGPDEVKLLARLVTAHYQPQYILPDLAFPGKAADMVAGGEYGARIAADRQGNIGGGVLWRWTGTKTLELFGPYIFCQPPELKLAEALVDACIADVSKSAAVEIISRYSNPDLPRGYFESLGTIDYTQPDGAVQRREIYYRQINEDPGCRVWVHPAIEDFLRAEYRRLFFLREVSLTGHEGEQRPPHSVFSPRFDRANSEITLKPVWDGADVSANLEQHIRVLKSEGLRNIFFEIDLAHAWQVNLTPALLQAGFRPCLVLPYGGDSDIVVFQYRGGN